MNDHEIQSRLEYLEETLRAWQKLTDGDDMPTVMIDVLAYMMHFAHSQDIDFDRVMQIAFDHFYKEIAELEEGQ